MYQRLAASSTIAGLWIICIICDSDHPKCTRIKWIFLDAVYLCVSLLCMKFTMYNRNYCIWYRRLICHERRNHHLPNTVMWRMRYQIFQDIKNVSVWSLRGMMQQRGMYALHSGWAFHNAWPTTCTWSNDVIKSKGHAVVIKSPRGWPSSISRLCPNFEYFFLFNRLLLPSLVTMSTVSTTWDWFSSVPLAHSAGTTISGWYEGAKNRCVLNYALSTVEATVKVAASAAHPVVQRFDSKSEFSLFLPSFSL